jgi:hypothetical protein
VVVVVVIIIIIKIIIIVMMTEIFANSYFNLMYMVLKNLMMANLIFIYKIHLYI